MDHKRRFIHRLGRMTKRCILEVNLSTSFTVRLTFLYKILSSYSRAIIFIFQISHFPSRRLMLNFHNEFKFSSVF